MLVLALPIALLQYCSVSFAGYYDGYDLDHSEEGYRCWYFEILVVVDWIAALVVGQSSAQYYADEKEPGLEQSLYAAEIHCGLRKRHSRR